MHPTSRTLAFMFGALLTTAVYAQVPALFKDAKPADGGKLVASHQCDACHAMKWARDGKDIYRPGQAIKSASQLLGKVEQCNAGTNANLFPEEVTDIAAWLNQTYYHFKN